MVNERKLYKIGQVTRLLGITSRTVRYYDQLGILPHVKRSTGGMRLFDDEDLDIIRNVRTLKKKGGIKLEAIRTNLYGKPVSAKTMVIITDGGVSVPSEFLTLFKIEVIPDHISLDGVNYDPSTESLSQFWARCKATNQSPQRVAPSVAAFQAAYQKYADQGYQQIFSIHTSSKVSNAYDNAKQAALSAPETITVSVHDTKTIGSGLGLLACQIGETVAHQEPIEQVLRFIAKQQPMSYLISMANSISDLALGNPLAIHPETQDAELAPITQLFKFKPVYSMNNVTGNLDITTCFRTIDEGVEFMLDQIAIEIAAIRGKYINCIMVTHLDMSESAKVILERVKEQYPGIQHFIQEASPTVSTLLGSQFVGISVA